MAKYDDFDNPKKGMHIASKLGCGCGCLPGLFLLLCGIVLTVLVALGKFNYSLAGTMSLVAWALDGVGAMLGMLGILLLLVGFILNKRKKSED
jgi:hypothetical protein